MDDSECRRSSGWNRQPLADLSDRVSHYLPARGAERQELGRPATSASTVTLADVSVSTTGCVIVATEYHGAVQNYAIRLVAIGC